MKKVIFPKMLLVFCLLAASVSLSAQDIILTRDSDIIEANVQEISDDIVTYKAFDNPDGPLYRIATAKIIKIKFKNGKEQTFSRVSGYQQPVVAAVADPAVPGGQMTYQHGDLYCNGIKLEDTDIQACMPVELYKQASGGLNMRKHGKRLVIAGSVLSAVGIASTIMGAVFMGNGTSYDRYGNVRYSDGAEAGAILYIGGAGILGAGGTCLAAGIPLYCVGQHRAKKAASAYNVSNGYPELSFNIGTTGNGFGVFMNF